MSVTYEATVGFEPQSETDLFNLALDTVWRSDDVNEQYAAFLIYDNPHQLLYGRSLPDVTDFGAEQYDRLLDFAASPEASTSLLVRAQALEYAEDMMHRSIGRDPDAARENGLLERQAALHALIPEVVLGQSSHLQSFSSIYRRPITSAAGRLIDREGLAENIVLQDWEEYDHDFRYEIPYNVPVIAFMLVEQLAKRGAEDLRLAESPLAERLMPLAVELTAAVGDTFGLTDRALERYRKVTKLSPIAAHGSDYISLTEHLSESRSHGSEYLDVLGDLYEAAGRLTEVFPARYAAGVEHGARELIASAMYVLFADSYMPHGRDIQLPLGDNPEALTLHLKKGEAVKLLTRLKTAIVQIHEDATACPVVPVVKSSQFQCYRFLSPEGSRTTAYVRPRGAVMFDPGLEYGRFGEGVEASIGFTTDLLPQDVRLSEVGKHRASSPDARISIRLDREGVRPGDRGKAGVQRDPTQAEGTLSLDVGSVLGDDEWFGTKVGRLLAWGNLLRSQRIDGKTSLNHVTQFFTPEDGNAEVFAAQAQAMSDALRLRERSFGPRQITAYYATRGAAN